MRKLIFTILLFIPILIIAQVQTLERYEIDHKYTDASYTVVSGRLDGLMVFRENGDYEKSKLIWEVIILDTALQVKYEHKIPLKSDFQLLGYEINDGFGYLLFRDGIDPRNDLTLIEISFSEDAVQELSIKNEIEIELSHFVVAHRNVILGGVVNSRPTLIHYSVNEKKVQVMPGLYRKETEIADIQSNINGTFNVVFVETENLQSMQILNVRIFASDGVQILESSAEFPENYNVHTAKVNRLEGTDLVVAGTYGIKNNKMSQGIFFVNLRPGDGNIVRFIEYTKLQNFFSFMGEKRERRIQDRISEATDAKPYEFRTNFIVWDLKEKDGKFLLYGEVTDPQYASSYRSRYGYGTSHYNNNSFDNDRFGTFGRYYSSPLSLVNRYEIISVKYNSGVLIELDKTGKVLFDTSRDIEDMETNSLEQISSYAVNGDNAFLIYKDKEEIFYSKYQPQQLSQMDTVVNVVSASPTGLIKDESEDGKIEFWYDHFFFMWGYEKLKDQISSERKRVFYINKIEIN